MFCRSDFVFKNDGELAYGRIRAVSRAASVHPGVNNFLRDRFYGAVELVFLLLRQVRKTEMAQAETKQAIEVACTVSELH